jgi:2-polyprenyl-3-methyl-5-hydroxy-6-metoxy-1,4-benzoquinol methylase
MQLLARPACRLCGRAGTRLYTGLRDRLFSAPGEWNLKQCPEPSCGLIWLDPEPAEQDVPDLYGGYYTHATEVSHRSVMRRAFQLSSAALLILTRVRGERKKLLRLFVDEILPAGDLLEIGCGGGDRLKIFAALGWSVTGQEIDPVAASRASATSGINIHVGPVRQLAGSGRRFDAIVMNHVIEHLLDPVTMLAMCRTMLRPGGRFVCVTPNARAWGHRTYGQNWMALDPPRHIALFTLPALRQAASDAGFDSPEVSTTCANAQVFAAGSLEIESTGRYQMGRFPTWRSEILSLMAQFRALAAFRRNPESGDELILRCRA